MGTIFLQIEDLQSGNNKFTVQELLKLAKDNVEKEFKYVKHITTVWGAGCVYYYFEVSNEIGKTKTYGPGDFEERD